MVEAQKVEFCRDGLDGVGINLPLTFIENENVRRNSESRNNDGQAVTGYDTPSTTGTNSSNPFNSTTNSDKGPNVTAGFQKSFATLVGNLSWWTTEENIINAIMDIGITDFVRVKFIEHRNTGQSTGNCVITVTTQSSLKRIWDVLPTKKIHERFPTCNPPTNHALQQIKNKGSGQNQGKMMAPGIPMGPDKMRMGFRPGMMMHSMPRFGPFGMNPRNMCPSNLRGSPQRNRPPMYFRPNNSAGPAQRLDGYFEGPQMNPQEMYREVPEYRDPVMNPHVIQPRNRPPMPHQMGCGPPINEGRAPQMNQQFQRTFLNCPPPPPWHQDRGPPQDCRPATFSGARFVNDSMPSSRDTHAAAEADSYTGDRDSPLRMSESELEEGMNRNKLVSSAAIGRSVAEAAEGEFSSSIETLVTAISLIKLSKVVNYDKGMSRILIKSLEDTLHGIESKAYGSWGRSRSKERERHRRRSSRRERSKSRDRENPEYRDRSQIRGHEYSRDRSLSRERTFRNRTSRH